ncbi:NHL repeat-containing protein [Aristaeella hokkaidonensis]|nr:NHL repeat-containing protein [Aristaeella hokkaidonensis]
MMKKAVSFLMILIMLFTACTALADDSFNVNKDGYSTSYTYGYDYWRDVQESPDAYRVETVIDSVDLGLDARMNKPQSLFARNNDLYVADTFNNRILQLEYRNGQAKLTRIIDHVAGGSPENFNTPYDVYVDVDGNIYVADYGNLRVVMMDKDLNWIKEFTKPADATFDQSLDFLPKKITVDVAGRLYALVTNVNKGIVKYESDTTFTGFIGATPVNFSTFDYIWKKYFMTQEQRDASPSFVPTEYENMYMDKDGFIYATLTNFDEGALDAGQVNPIRRLNGLGNDILIANDRYPPIGDLWWQKGESSYFGPARLTDITVFDNDIYIVLDRIRGRLFGYDSQGIMLWAFGTRGNIEGAFTSPISLEHIGNDLFVLDQLENSITIFTPTEYGLKIYDAINKYQDGDYDESANVWTEVLRQNANYPMAFRGIGRTVLRQNKFEEAMEYFKMAHDRENYGRTFKLYRKEWIEKNALWIFLGVILLLIVPLILGRIKRMKWEVIMHEQSKIRRNAE